MITYVFTDNFGKEYVNSYEPKFSEISLIVKRLNDLQESLKWTKHITDAKEFEDVWLNDEQVKEYREKLMELWGYTPEKWIVSKRVICERCKNITLTLTDLYRCEIKYKDISFSFVHIYCKECMEYAKIAGDIADTDKVEPYKEDMEVY